MEKGKLGVRPNTWAVIAFVLALFGQTLLCGLLLGFVLVVEKEERVARQCMTAFFLTLVWKAIAVVAGLMLAVSGLASEYYYWRVGSALGVLTILVIAALAILLVVFTVIGLVSVSKGRDANVPVLSGLADRAFGFVKPQPQPQYPPQGGYYPQGQPGQQPPQAPPYGQAYPPQQPYAAPPPPVNDSGYPAGGPPPPPPPPISAPGGNDGQDSGEA